MFSERLVLKYFVFAMTPVEEPTPIFKNFYIEKKTEKQMEKCKNKIQNCFEIKKD